MNYQKQYELLIEKHGSLDKPSGYSERHHILPKSMGGSNDPINLVYLTPKAHYVAHYLLFKIHGKGPMAMAFWAMCSMGTGTTVNARSFSVSRSAMIESSFGRNSGEKHPFFGKKLPKETRRKMSDAKSGKLPNNIKLADVYDFATGALVAEGVVLGDWVKGKGLSKGHMSKTANGHRKQHGGYYARYR